LFYTIDQARQMELLIACLIFLWCSHYQHDICVEESQPGFNDSLKDSNNISDPSCESEFDHLARIDYSVGILWLLYCHNYEIILRVGKWIEERCRNKNDS